MKMFSVFIFAINPTDNFNCHFYFYLALYNPANKDYFEDVMF